MSGNFIAMRTSGRKAAAGLALVCAGLLVAACSDQPTSPSATRVQAASAAPGLAHGGTLATAAAEPFTVRAPLDPYRINQPPDFMVHSRARTDIVMQRSVFVPGPGAWHTHPGPTFVFVAQGQIKLTQFSEKEGCVDTPVFGPGDAYFEEGNEVHRATVLSAENAVLHVTRFNIPVGGAITTPAADPGC